MKRLYEWLLSCKRWLILTVLSISLLVLGGWALTSRTGSLVLFSVIWLIHLALGFGAGYAALRLWYFRHHPLIKWVGVYITAFIVDVISAIGLLFVARGVTLTWKFSAVMFLSTLVSNFFRAPLIFYLIRGPETLPMPVEMEKSGEKPPEFWMRELGGIKQEIAELRKEVARLMRQRSKAGRKPPRAGN